MVGDTVVHPHRRVVLQDLVRVRGLAKYQGPLEAPGVRGAHVSGQEVDQEQVEEGIRMNRAELDKFVNHWMDFLMKSGAFALVMSLLGTVVFIDILVNWRIVKRMGYPGIWSLFLWMPYASQLFWLGISLWRWPNQRK